MYMNVLSEKEIRERAGLAYAKYIEACRERAQIQGTRNERRKKEHEFLEDLRQKRRPPTILNDSIHHNKDDFNAQLTEYVDLFDESSLKQTKLTRQHEPVCLKKLAKKKTVQAEDSTDETTVSLPTAVRSKPSNITAPKPLKSHSKKAATFKNVNLAPILLERLTSTLQFAPCLELLVDFSAPMQTYQGIPQTILLSKDCMILGRQKATCDVVFDSPMHPKLISKEHAMIITTRSLASLCFTVRIHDCDSTNGTFINGTSVDKQGKILQDGDVVSLGSSHERKHRLAIRYLFRSPPTCAPSKAALKSKGNSKSSLPSLTS